MRRLFVRSLAVAFLGVAAFFGLEFYVEWRRAGFPGPGATEWAGINNAKLVDILSPMARAYNNALAMLLGLIGLAVPLTANMHTPKLIELFLKDGINRVVLLFMGLGAAHVLWVIYLIGPNFAPTWAIALAVYLAIAGWVVLIPYFFYVMRWLDPSRMVARLRIYTRKLLRRVAKRTLAAVPAQADVSNLVSHLGTIMRKSLDRDDRDVTREGIWALKQLIDDYAAVKRAMPPEWFPVDRADFIGLSREALDMLSESRTWFEMKCLLQLELVFGHALTKGTDIVSACSDALRVIATSAHARRDDELLRLCIRFFNNYAREAIKSRNLRAVYDVFHQYRVLTREIVERADLLREIGAHFEYYAGMAKLYGMIFAPQLALFDLGYIVRRAYESNSPAASDLLDRVLGMPHQTGDDLHSMAIKAKLVLGGFFLENKQPAEAHRVAQTLANVPDDELAQAEAELLDASRTFFEVTDRQVNVEYVPPERREPLKEFCRSLRETAWP